MLLGFVVAVPLIYGASLLAVAIARASVDEHVIARYASGDDASTSSVSAYRGPCASVEADAVAYHAALASKLSKATASYLFGAENLGPSGSPVSESTYVLVGALNTPGWIDLVPDNAERTAREFLERYRTALGDDLPDKHSDNFSLVVVGPLPTGELRVTAVAQVVSSTATISDKGLVTFGGHLQWARLWTAEGYLDYAWVLPATREGAQSWKPRASQYWLKLDDLRGVYEPGLAICRFPDPAPALESPETIEQGIARFTYVL